MAPGVPTNRGIVIAACAITGEADKMARVKIGDTEIVYFRDVAIGDRFFHRNDSGPILRRNIFIRIAPYTDSAPNAVLEDQITAPKTKFWFCDNALVRIRKRG